MRFLFVLVCVIAPTLILLVDPVPKPPMQTVDTVAGCVDKYWRGTPIEKWNDAEDMEPVCRSILNKAREANR
jgi:hypothetical protein